jgi:hypothetical protein
MARMDKRRSTESDHDAFGFLNHYHPRRHGSIQEVILGLTLEFVGRDPELHTAIQQHSDLVDECERNPDPR